MGQNFLEFTLTLNDTDAYDLVALLDHHPLPGFCGYYEILYHEGKQQNESRQLVLYFEPGQSPRERELQVEILLAASRIESYRIETQFLSSDNYLEEYKKHFFTFAVGKRLCVVPAWEEPPIGRLPVRIDPGLAFGTGLHPTTRLCLEWLDGHMPEGRAIVDAGCGSGILSIAALRLGARLVFALDIESQAVRSTLDNLRLNGLSARVERCGLERVPIFLTEHSDALLLGNLTSGILRAGSAFLQAADDLVLSGFLLEQRDLVLQLFPVHECIASETKEGWALVWLRRIR
ncbi:MAG: 50S ribosomal protein L11 methyltransferase [Spirochaetales bacterium]|nr:50S ribosomal protein L11 methyltransferase [Spirochaetales bacterium]